MKAKLLCVGTYRAVCAWPWSRWRVAAWRHSQWQLACCRPADRCRTSWAQSGCGCSCSSSPSRSSVWRRRPTVPRRKPSCSRRQATPRTHRNHAPARVTDRITDTIVNPCSRLSTARRYPRQLLLRTVIKQSSEWHFENLCQLVHASSTHTKTHVILTFDLWPWYSAGF